MLAHIQKIRKEQETGFTLIELLVVILIVGVLAAIAIPMFLSQRKSAIDASTVSDTHTLSNAIETEHVKTPYEAMTAAQFSPVPLSKGTQWTMTSDANGYCLMTYNAGGDQYTSTTSAATYDSAAGGLNKTGNECPAPGAVSPASATNTIGTPGAISFIDSDNPSNTITADGSYSYNDATQEVTYAFDFKNLDPAKTYYILINPVQNNNGDPTTQDAAFNQYTVTAASSHVSATVSLKGVWLGSPRTPLTTVTSVKIFRGFSMNPGYGTADINDPSPLVVK